eukprot:TRINITY_DN5318_c0_g1_i1.p1 TRINITY_DN5318_c0_g1~~TRINITY_DN5318_c0_g1_i1.p1  ORF type:complete len:901 (+),score=153.92 TRINITY_DN5318_c0_g1_i1:107-2809(+)
MAFSRAPKRHRWTSTGAGSSHAGFTTSASRFGDYSVAHSAGSWTSGRRASVAARSAGVMQDQFSSAGMAYEDEDAGALGNESAGSMCALIESRAREVGLASVHQRSMEFQLTQFSDCGNYSRTLSAVLALEPSVVVVSRTARGTHLLQVLEEALCSAGLPAPQFVERRYFDETEGQGLLDEAEVTGLQPSEYGAKFVACAALAALWHFTESVMESRLQASSVSVMYRGPADTMFIDNKTARLLELVADARDHRERGSVFGLFTCRTPGGSRLLRQSLLQPPATKTEIEARQDAVEALLKNEKMFFEFQRLLPAIRDIDLLAARLTSEPRTRGPQWCKAVARTAVRLRHALSALPLIADALASDGCSSRLFGELRVVFTHAKFPKLLEELDRVLDSNSPPTTGGRGSMAHAALLYAVRPGVCAILDVARQTWNEALEQIHALHRSQAVNYPELNIRLEYTERRGWYLSHDDRSMPSEFVRMPNPQRGTKGGRQLSSTQELLLENFKLRQAEREILTETVAVLDGLFQVLRTEAPLLYRVSHAASVLDLLQAFVGYTLQLGEFARPEVSDAPDAPTAIKAGRHPLMERVFSQQVAAAAGGSFEALDYFVGENCHFQAITGANGGGKSTYLQTLAQLTVLAQIGCCIPARFAKLRLVSSLFTRIGTADSIESNASTFFVEMREMAYILRDVTPESLVLIDELGRGTAHAEGIAICWAVCERLLELKVYTLFATHFFEICRLQAVYPSFRNMHLQTSDEGSREGGSRQFTVHHVTSLESLLAKGQARYGLRAAEQAGLPTALIASARRMAKTVDQRLARLLPSNVARDQEATLGGATGAPIAMAEDISKGKDEQDVELALDTAKQLCALAAVGSSLSREGLAEVLRRLQRPWLRQSPSTRDQDE